jgi:drug/metabolite transporter superfamily protein YnfA
MPEHDPRNTNPAGRSHARAMRLAVVLLSLATLIAGFGTPAVPARRADTPATLPALRDEAAVAHLKSQGLYDSLGEAITAAQYGITARPGDKGELATKNPAQRLRAEFGRDGLLLESGMGEERRRLNMRLRSVGYGERQLAAGAATLAAEGQRVEYTHELAGGAVSPVREWFVNRPDGLEQGFTLAEPPGERQAGERLRLVLGLGGELRARATSDGQAVELVDGAGQVALRYDHLLVTDALGRELRARMAVAGDELRLEVEDAGATYPVTIDPTFAQPTYLKASNTGADDYFGVSLAVSGDTAVVGAYREASAATGIDGDQSDNSVPWAGAAYVFVRDGAAWSQQAYLKASNVGAGDGFGISVAVSGDTIVVGAWGESSAATGVNGDQLDNSAQYSGAAYVFVRNGTTWSQQAYLKASNPETYDNFGNAVAIAGDTVVVASAWESSGATGVDGDQTDNSVPEAGAVYVFTRSGTTWSQQAYLKASNPGLDDEFGIALAMSGDTIVVGAGREASAATGVDGDQSDDSAFRSGAAYVFVRSGTTWSQQAYLKASNTAAYNFFGNAVAVSGDTIVVGASSESSAATGVNGDQSDTSAPESGAAYVFVRSGTTWSQQAYLKASNTGAGDGFGAAVAVSGDTIVVGAWAEASAATGVDGDQSDNSVPFSGAAYVFGRSGTTWSQQAYLKASNTGTWDSFGASVAVSGDTVIVGARDEGSAATGVDGDGANNTAPSSGAIYVFAKPGYDFSGFFEPVDNLPTVNLVTAGRAIPVMFSLSGDQGLDIFAAGFPASQQIACDTSSSVSTVEVTVAAGGSSLSYDPATDIYTYVWKTDKAWKGTCRQLTVRLSDGSEHKASFQFR